MLLINLLLAFIFVVSAFTVLYTFIFSVSGHFMRKREYDCKNVYKKIAVLIPAYCEDAVILQSANHALFQKYPSHKYDVIVIGDSLQKETIQQLKKLPLKFVEVKFETSTKSKSLNAAFDIISDQYDIAVVLDADNLMKSDFLDKINAAFVNGCYAIQGNRQAKNINTSFAILDAMSEEANNHIFRKGQQALGFSSSIIGSGMAISYLYLKQVMRDIDAVGGFDKELEMKLIGDNHKITFLSNAVVLDEKVQQSAVFASQRTRWISAQFIYLRKYFFKGVKALLKGRLDYANKTAHYALVPKILLIGFLLFVTTLCYFGNDYLTVGFKSWTTLTVLYFTSFVIAIPRKFYNLKTLKALIFLPKAFAVMALAMFKVKGANKKFIHTPHSSHFEKESI